VSAYVNGCMDCDQNKKATVSARHPTLSYHAGSLMERVHLEPLPRTEKGNEHILMMVDQFTKWVECIPLPSQSAEETARAAVNQFFSRFGCPFQVFTDQWRNFESTLFRAMCDLLHIHKSRTTPYRPSANGEIERCNRTLMAAVRCFIGRNHRSWNQ
jgi:transposase InsO family protein